MLIFDLHAVPSNGGLACQLYTSKATFKDGLRGHLTNRAPIEANALLARLDEVWRDQPQHICTYHIYGDDIRYGLTECGDLRKKGRTQELLERLLTKR